MNSKNTPPRFSQAVHLKKIGKVQLIYSYKGQIYVYFLDKFKPLEKALMGYRM